MKASGTRSTSSRGRAWQTAVDKLIAELPAGHDEAAGVRVHETVAVGVAMVFGWILPGERLLKITGLAPERQGEVDDLVLREMGDVAKAAGRALSGGR